MTLIVLLEGAWLNEWSVFGYISAQPFVLCRAAATSSRLVVFFFSLFILRWRPDFRQPLKAAAAPPRPCRSDAITRSAGTHVRRTSSFITSTQGQWSTELHVSGVFTGKRRRFCHLFVAPGSQRSPCTLNRRGSARLCSGTKQLKGGLIKNAERWLFGERCHCFQLWRIWRPRLLSSPPVLHQSSASPPESSSSPPISNIHWCSESGEGHNLTWSSDAAGNHGSSTLRCACDAGEMSLHRVRVSACWWVSSTSYSGFMQLMNIRRAGAELLLGSGQDAAGCVCGGLS